MQQIIKNILLFTVFCFLTSCSNDFLNEDLSPVSSPIGLSNIYISPEWGSTQCAFKLPTSKSADFEIVSKPSWLTITPASGKLVDSVALVQCVAELNSTFEEIGVYTDFMTVKADGRNFKIPVSYITEGNPEIEVSDNVDLSYFTNVSPFIELYNTGLGVLIWDVVSMPDWLTVDIGRLDYKSRFIGPANISNLPLKFVPTDQVSGELTGTIVLSTNDKKNPNVTISVSNNLGTPRLSINTSLISFGSADITQTLYFNNSGSGILVWNFEDIPNWLTISNTSGRSHSYDSYGSVAFNCDRSKLLPGQNTAVVQLKSNDSLRPSYSITVTAVAPGDNANTRAVVGDIIDVAFDQKSNTLFYVTSAPSKFIAYNVKTKSIVHEIALSKVPTCFAISEDWTKAAVGHNGSLSAINLSDYTLTANYIADYSINDIVWAEGDWFCYTPKGGNFTNLHWVNIANGNKIDNTSSGNLDASSTIKKVPNQPFIIATRGGSSPSGFFSFSIATKSLKSYSHMSLSNFWLSEDGEYVFAKNTNVYRTTSSTGSSDTFNANINAIAKINLIGSSYNINFINHSHRSLWLIYNDSFSNDSPTSVYQYEDNDYTLLKKYEYNQLYQPNAQANTMNVKATYVFANNEETEIVVLCKDIASNVWNMQFVEIK